MHDLRNISATWHREAGTPAHELQRLGGGRLNPGNRGEAHSYVLTECILLEFKERL